MNSTVNQSLIFIFLMVFCGIANADICAIAKEYIQQDDVRGFLAEYQEPYLLEDEQEGLCSSVSGNCKAYEFPAVSDTTLSWATYTVGSAYCQRHIYELESPLGTKLLNGYPDRQETIDSGLTYCGEGDCCSGHRDNYISYEENLYVYTNPYSGSPSGPYISEVNVGEAEERTCSFEVIEKKPLEYDNYTSECSGHGVCEELINRVSLGETEDFDVLKRMEDDDGLIFADHVYFVEDPRNRIYVRCRSIDFNNDQIGDAVCVSINYTRFHNDIDLYLNLSGHGLELVPRNYFAERPEGFAIPRSLSGRSDDELVPSRLFFLDYQVLNYMVYFSGTTFSIYLAQGTSVEFIGKVSAPEELDEVIITYH